MRALDGVLEGSLVTGWDGGFGWGAVGGGHSARRGFILLQVIGVLKSISTGANM